MNSIIFKIKVDVDSINVINPDQQFKKHTFEFDTSPLASHAQLPESMHRISKLYDQKRPKLGHFDLIHWCAGRFRQRFGLWFQSALGAESHLLIISMYLQIKISRDQETLI